jgi:hypothetical protein
LEPEVRALRDVADPEERARSATALLGRLKDAETELHRIRSEAADELLATGKTHAQVAEILGVTRGRIGQIKRASPAPERAFLGDGMLTIVLGQKREEGKGRPVVAQETTIAARRLGKLAADHKLESVEEYIPPPGVVQLNRENLIFLAGPRLFPMVGQILDGDPTLRFHKDDNGVWYVLNHDTGTEYYAPRDKGMPRDLGYLGRLPRPDGRGTFLVCAGVHATGTQGVVAYLETHMAELYREVKLKRFSALIECDYDPDTLTVTAARRLGPIYRHGS